MERDKSVRRAGMLVLCVLSLPVGVTGGRIRAAEQVTPTPHAPITRNPSRARLVAVTAVEGPSTLHHLGLTIEHSSMGWDGQWSGPPSTVPPPPSGQVGPIVVPPGSFILGGADLYRASCRACHKPDGSGAPPEINSLIGPVQSASAQWVSQRMRAMGRSVGPSFIRQLASGAEADLRKRLSEGGHNMPSFAHLWDEEYRVLRAYLDQIAGVPAVKRQPLHITEPAVRIGELIVKGTCHICHDATGPDRGATTVLSGVIPSLSSITRTKTLAQFVEKVCEGTPVALGAGGVSSRGRMPVLNYLSKAEAGSAYSYLITYPPK
jgi:mono/diheme cytochrome c family protein